MTGIHKEKTENGIREILFRGKSIDGGGSPGEWMYGSLIHQTDYYGEKIDQYRIVDGETTEDNDIGFSEKVDSDTIGQFTGMLDKNGKKIFEGDLILWPDSFEDGGLEAACEIVWAEGGWAAHEQGFNPDRITQRDMEECEIIGNIHDTPELYQG